MGNTERLTEDIRAERQGLPPRPTEELREREVSPHERFLELPVPIVAEVEETQVTRATWRLGKLKAAGVELHEILGGRAGAAFIRDYCGGDPEVAYAAIAFVYFRAKATGPKGLPPLSSPFSLSEVPRRTLLGNLVNRGNLRPRRYPKKMHTSESLIF